MMRDRLERLHIFNVVGRIFIESASFEEAMGFEPAMQHVSEFRAIQPEELSALRESVGEEVLSTPVEIEHQYTEEQKSAPSVVHQAENSPCGFRT
jgi:hypothetical protein